MKFRIGQPQQRDLRHRLHLTPTVVFAAMTAAAVLCITTAGVAQEAAPQQGQMHYGVRPWTGGHPHDALSQASSGSTIPMSEYTVNYNRGAYAGVLVGGDPYTKGPAPVTINAVVVPLIIQIIKTNGTLVTFDPTKANSCDGGVSAETRFKQSPLVVNSSLKFNGTSVGSVQYINGFMNAEFWKKTGGAASYSNPIHWTYGATLTAPPFVAQSTGLIVGSGCSKMGVVTNSFLDLFLDTYVAALNEPTKFVVFLMENVVESTVAPPTFPANCCIGGYHSAQGSPVETWGLMEYDTAGHFGGVHDITVLSHEVGEWMNDPLGNNPVPAWGNIGQTSGCQSNLEVGDPLSQTDMPTITLSGYAYHAQELAFFSWFFNADGTASLGTGGKFSGNGTFKGPSKDCPPGGTF